MSTATQERDAGIEQVSRNEKTWLEEAHALIPTYPEKEVTGEDLRMWIEQRIGAPHHFNAAGAMIMGAIRKGLLTNTGRYVAMKRRASHARKNPLYVINR